MYFSYAIVEYYLNFTQNRFGQFLFLFSKIPLLACPQRHLPEISTLELKLYNRNDGIWPFEKKRIQCIHKWN